jgi:serine/threonine protein kinase
LHVADEIARTLQCANCRRVFPPGTAGVCPDDQGELLPDPLIGTLFADKYEIISLLGEGGMSRVYRARHTLMNRVVAIKLLYERPKDSVARARFQQEAEAASLLSHPNVVTVHDFGLTAAGQPYFIMDCLDGTSLCDLLAEKRFLKLQQAVEIFTQACDGLDHAHRKGIIHRDVKPSNLVIIKQEDGQDLVKLVDFGIAKFVSPDTEKLNQKKITQTGEVFGTPAYMSPEQCNGRALDARSDIYSFGCLMYETLSGEPPLWADTFVSTVVKHVSEIPVPLSQKCRQKIPADLESVIMKCLEKDPQNRFHSAAELKQALLDAAYVSGLKGLKVGAVPEPRKLSASGRSTAPELSLSGKTSRKLRWRNVIVITLLSCLPLFSGVWLFFFFQGPEGDTGTFFEKVRWQAAVTSSEELARDNRNSEAIRALEDAAKMTRKFGDDNRRLEFTLNKLVEAYAANHDSEKVEDANYQLARIDDGRLYAEYDSLMARLSRWHEPSQSAVRREERAQQAAAFADRISRCAEKLASRSKSRQEKLLKFSARTYDLLNLKEGIYRSSFRIQLAEIYRDSQRSQDELSILEEALAHSAKDPETARGWRCKIRVSLLAGELDANRGKLEKARQELDSALEWTRKRLPADRDLQLGCLNACAQLYGKFHDSKSREKADALVREYKELSKQLNSVKANSRNYKA